MTDFNTLKDEIERQMHRVGQELHGLMDRVTPLMNDDVDFSPRCDMVEAGERTHVFMDLPGVEKKDILITLKDQSLLIRGERRLKTDPEQKVTRRERKGGFFSRTFAVPAGLQKTDLKASFHNGVLDVSFPTGTNQATGQDEDHITIE